MTTKDVGGGLQMVDLSKAQGEGGAIDQYQKFLSITDLANRIQQAPLEREAKLQENALRQSQVDLIPLAQKRAQFEFEAAQAGEQRAKSSQYFSHLGEVTSAFDQDFEQGTFALQNVIPGAKAKKLDDGSVSIVAPTPGGGISTFRLFPGSSKPDPKDVQSGEQNLRTQWENRSKAFIEVDQNYRAMQNYAANPSGPGDLALIISYAKILDPGSVVREGEIEVIKNTTNLPAALVAKYRGLVSDPKAASLDPDLRKEIVRVSGLKVQPLRDDLKNLAQSMAPVWKRGGYSPERIYTQVGSLTQKEMFGANTTSPDSATGGNSNQQRKTVVPPGENRSLGPQGRGAKTSPNAAQSNASNTQPAALVPAQAPPKLNLRNMTGGALQRLQKKGQ